MPLYEYECSNDECNYADEILTGMTDTRPKFRICMKCSSKMYRSFSSATATGFADDWSAQNGGKGKCIPQFGPGHQQYFKSPEKVDEYAKKQGMSTFRT